MAPEILMNSGYTKNIDFWTIGIFAYELAVGNPPFYDKTRNFDKI